MDLFQLLWITVDFYHTAALLTHTVALELLRELSN